MPFQNSSALRQDLLVVRTRELLVGAWKGNPGNSVLHQGLQEAKDLDKGCKTVFSYRKWSPLLLPPRRAVPLPGHRDRLLAVIALCMPPPPSLSLAPSFFHLLLLAPITL